MKPFHIVGDMTSQLAQIQRRAESEDQRLSDCLSDHPSKMLASPFHQSKHKPEQHEDGSANQYPRVGVDKIQLLNDADSFFHCVIVLTYLLQFAFSSALDQGACSGL